MLCEYGCNQEAKYTFKNGKFCCSKMQQQCPTFRRVRSEKYSGKNHPLYGKKFSEESKRKMSLSHIGLQAGSKHPLYGKNLSPELILKMNKKKKGKPTWNKGLKTGPLSEEIKIKLRITCKGKRKPSGFGEKVRQRMLNGGAIIALRGNKNPSKAEVKLRDLVKELYPNCEFQYQVFNYSLDIAILEYKIAIEYDGWYHFDCQEHIDYHKNRKEKIESEGWKFIKYTIYDKFPDKNKIHLDISGLII